MQAGTFLHEWGHNAELTHGGRPGDPNCKPTYLSVMNYLYQLRGLLDDFGRPNLDLSRDVIDPAVDETSLSDALASLPYRLGWYAPLAESYLAGRGTAAAKHCDGGSLTATDVPMVRIDARTAAGPIDWNANGNASESGYSQDVNFNGRTTATPGGSTAELLEGFDDWANIRLNQVGARRNVGGPFFDGTSHQILGPLSASMGRWDFGRWDFASSDLGRWDFGVGDASRGDLGQGDYGRWDFGRWDFGRWDFGRWDFGQPASGRGDEARGYLGGGDLFVNDPNNPGGELDLETAADLAKTPPNEFQACVIGVDCAGLLSPNHRVRASWTATNVGGVVQYAVYRVQGAALLPGQPWTLAATVDAVPGQDAYTVIDGAQLTNGVPYTYFALARYGDVQSDPSKLVTITGVNDPPTAGNDSYSVAEDTVLTGPAPGVLANDDDPDTDSTLTAAVVSGPSHGTLVLNPNGAFTYTPDPNYNGPDSFTYKANDGTTDTNVATVTITVTAVNDPPVMTTNIADRTIDANGTTGPIGFVIADDDPGGVAVSGSSSNTTLVPGANIVFGGTGPARTVTVTPATNQSGTATITVTVTDSGGLTASDSFVLTVRQSNYTLVGVQNVPPAPIGKTFKAGSSVPMKWQFKNGAIVVNSSQVAHTVTVRGPLPAGPIRIITNTDSGSSSFRYDATTRTWQFNLQTKEPNGQSYAIGLYEVTITPSTPGYASSPTFQMQLVK
jgi:VCBS repeat-containing protein